MKVLIIDDSLDFSSTILDIIKSLGVEAESINTINEAINYMKQKYNEIDLILLDIEFGFSEKLNGLDLLDIFRRTYPSIPVVMITGKGTIEMAVKATKLGAVNFIEKNIITKTRIKGLIDTIIKDNYDEEDIEAVRYLEENGIIGKSKLITELRKNIINYAKADLNILITGEIGTGKKSIAAHIHKLSRRNKNDFVMLDIPNLKENTYRDELFGTAIDKNNIKNGLFHKADKGILFLGELDTLGLDLQSLLLLPIGAKQVRKVGETNVDTLDIRFISTTTKNLVMMMQSGSFNEQLYHILRESEIHIPALRSRKEDIPYMVNYFTGLYNKEQVRNKYFPPSSLDYLAEHQWLGNVRELHSFTKLCLQTVSTDTIEVSDLIKTMQVHNGQNNFKDIVLSGLSLSEDKTLKEDLAEVDKIKIENTLIKTSGNVSKAAALLGVSRETLHNKIRRYGINAKDYRNKEK